MRTNNESAALRELHEIHAKHYEETKHLTIAESIRTSFFPR